jgi:hypothetical protein
MVSYLYPLDGVASTIEAHVTCADVTGGVHGCVITVGSA